jgi:hypothetical protein
MALLQPQIIAQGLGFLNQIIGGKTSGYAEVYPPRERDNTFLIVLLFVLVIAGMTIGVFALKKTK